jgi:hypothetical protein
MVRFALILFVLIYVIPPAISAFRYRLNGPGPSWRDADRSSAGLLPVRPEPRTVRWRGILAMHCWIVFKPAGAATYTRYDYTAWGEPIRINGFAADGRWFGRIPDTVFAADGRAADLLIPRIEAAIAGYAWRNLGDYHAWPGPNSNTFVAAVIDAMPEAHAVLPPLAIGKDFPYDRRWLRPTASGTGFRLTLGGYAGLTVAWMEGVELNLLGLVAGFDLRRPAIKLPGLGRLGLPAIDIPTLAALPSDA